MELMDTSLDKFYKQVIDRGLTIPEDILGKIAVSVSVCQLIAADCQKAFFCNKARGIRIPLSDLMRCSERGW